MRSRRFTPRRPFVRLEALESRDVPSVDISPGRAAPFLTPDVFAAGVNRGGEPTVRLIDARTGGEVARVEAFERSFRGGVRVAVGDVTGDGTPDLVVGAGSAGGPVIKIFDGATLEEAFSFAAYEESFRGGVFVAVGDTNNDDKLEILAGTGNGGGPRVRIFETNIDASGAVTGVTPVADFFAYEPSFRGGVQVSSGDVDDDGFDDVVTGTGVGGGPRVQVFGGRDRREMMNFFAFEESFRNGVQVTTGDVDGDGRDDVVAGAGEGGGPRVRVFDGGDGRDLSDFFAFDDDFRGGVLVGVVDSDGDGKAEIIVGAGSGDDPVVRRFDNFGQLVSELKAFLNDFRGGVQVGGDRGGEDDDDRDDRKLVGTVAAVDLAERTLDVETAAGLVTVPVNDRTKIKFDSVDGALAGVEVGDRVEVKLDRDGAAKKIRVEAAAAPPTDPTPLTRVEGPVTAVNEDAGTLTVLDDGRLFLVELADGAAIVGPDGLPLTLADIDIGARVEADIGADGLATRVEVVDETPGPIDPTPLTRVEGPVTAVNVDARTLTILDDGRLILVELADDAVIDGPGDLPLTLADIAVGDRVEAVIGPDGLATRVELSGGNGGDDDDDDGGGDDDDDDDGGDDD